MNTRIKKTFQSLNPSKLLKLAFGFLMLAVLTLTPSTFVMAQAGQPTLTLSDNNGTPGSEVTIEVNYAGNGNNISAIAFSLDYDESKLAFDDSDNDGDGYPDSVALNMPGAFNGTVMFDASDSAGEIDLLVADMFPPLATIPDGLVAAITFTVLSDATGTAAVNFSPDPAASFGSTTGQSIPGTTTGGVVNIGGVDTEANFTCSPTSGQPPLEVTCNDASMGNITGWQWDFGDGTTSTEQNPPAHTYNADGSYTVSLTVTGPDGNDTETRTNYISVGATAASCDVGDGNSCVLARGNVFPSIEDIIFESFVLDGQIGTTSASTGGNVLDSDISDAGWSIYVAAAAPFVDDDNNQIPIGGEDDLTVECLTISTDDGQTAPTCHTIDHVRLVSDADKTTIISASPGTATGTYNFTTDFVLTIPGDTVAGNYTTTIYIDRQIGSDGP